MKRSAKRLTEKERDVVMALLDEILEKVNYDEEMQCYTDAYGDILVSLSKSEYLAAKRAYRKLLLGQIEREVTRDTRSV